VKYHLSLITHKDRVVYFVSVEIYKQPNVYGLSVNRGQRTENRGQIAHLTLKFSSVICRLTSVF
jgi:hypothetical protein